MGTVDEFDGYSAGYVRRTFNYSLPGFPLKVLLLAGDVEGERQYMALFDHFVIGATGKYLSRGGQLNRIGERAFSVLSYDWSRPAFDPFGIPADWVPPADASLVGGSAGEPSYQYYLRAARQAAVEASTAVQTAIDTLTEETLQSVALQAAEERAEGIAEIEITALCGRTSDCTLSTRLWTPEIPECLTDANGVPLTGERLAWCELARTTLDKMLPAVRLPNIVLDANTAFAPNFRDYQGSQLQSVLIRQWAAVQKVQGGIESTMDLSIALGTEVEAAQAARAAAQAEFLAAVASANAEIAMLDDSITEIDALLLEMGSALSDRANRLTQLTEILASECEDTLDLSELPHDVAERITFVVEGNPSKFIFDPVTNTVIRRPNPKDANYGRCKATEDGVRMLEDQALGFNSAFLAKVRSLVQKRDTLDEQSREAIISGLRSAAVDQVAKIKLAGVAPSRALAQLTPAATQVHEAMGELLGAGAELSQLRLKSESQIALAELETNLAQFDAEARFGLSRKFRSYDLWRARALLESSRRLAVAARRAVEAHFVVDLSELQSPQAFVDAPALWSDEVYRPDLDAPTVVGLSVSPDIAEAVFPNQILDYVENLERFVQGYTISYPTSVAVPDTEAITLPGPDFVQRFDDPEGPTIVDLDPGVLGWRFYCPQLDAWVPHPGVGETPLATRAKQACNGERPTRARYDFSMDPWARRNNSIGNEPLDQRHNVQWRRLAVNLVGTGIRDCELAGEPLECYSEAFLRFSLAHAGPSWTTNHAQQWRAFDLPTAFIEDGKALATEEWIDPVANSWNLAFVSNVTRGEFAGRPVDGAYELTLELTPDVRIDRIEHVQLLVETAYWVRQQ
jgi:hypothetical protein